MARDLRPESVINTKINQTNADLQRNERQDNLNQSLNESFSITQMIKFASNNKFPARIFKFGSKNKDLLR